MKTEHLPSIQLYIGVNFVNETLIFSKTVLAFARIPVSRFSALSLACRLQRPPLRISTGGDDARGR